MAGGRVALAHVRRMAIAANKFLVLIDCLKLIAQIQAQSLLVMTLGAAGYWDIRLESSQCRGFGDVYVTGRTFGNVLLARVSKLH